MLLPRDARAKKSFGCHRKRLFFVKQIRSMTFEELVYARAQIVAALELHHARERRALINILEGRKAPAVGSTRDAEVHPLKGKRLPPKYRNPEDPSQVWAGRGNKPRWLAAALKKRGVTLESFLIA